MMPKYEKYKESGVEWLGEIPEHWKVNRVKDYATRVQTGTTPKTSILEYWEDENFNWFTPSDFTDNFRLIDSDRKISRKAIEKGVARLFRKNSVLIIGIASVGKVGLLVEEGSSNQQINAIEYDSRINPVFGAYVLKVYEDEIVKFANYSIVPIFNQSETGCLYISIPAKFEQTAIANYLDEKTAQIDKLIENKKKQIDRLKEIRQIEINNAVTKGLNPNAKLKPSGIEWLGDIPEHWGINRIKNLSALSNEKVYDYIDDDYFVALENIESWTGKYIESENGFEEGGIRFNSNDVLFGKLRPYLAKVYRPDKEGVCVSEILAIRPDKRVLQDFLFFRMLSTDFISVINSSTFGAKMPRANWQYISNLKMPYPDVQEQEEIAKYLNEVFEKGSILIVGLETQIEQLIEIRKIEIYNAVTGKIKVA